MPRPTTQARAARKLRRAVWIANDPDADALAQQLVYLAETADAEMAEHGRITAAVAAAYLETRSALLDLRLSAIITGPRA